MLSAQVEYWKLQENKRHNIETETQGWFTIRETGRHNLVTEEQGWQQIAETKRHNVESEALGWGNLAETKRHNMSTEYETARHNVATEDLGWANVGIGRLNAQANLQNAASNARNAATNEWAAYENALLRVAENRIAQQRADTEAERTEWQRQHDAERLAYEWLGYTNTAYGTENQNEYWDSTAASKWTQTIGGLVIGGGNMIANFMNVFD